MGFAGDTLEKIHEINRLIEKHGVRLPEELREKWDNLLSDVYEEYEYERDE